MPVKHACLLIALVLSCLHATGRAQELEVMERTVSPKVAKRLQLAARALRFVKRAVPHSGNQRTGLEATQGNSYYRAELSRNLWIPGRVPSTQALAESDRVAAQAALIACTGGGRCGENATLAFHYLKGLGSSQTFTNASIKGLDHAFVLIGDLTHDPLDEIVVVDPWVTHAQPLLYSDFVFKKERSEIDRFYTARNISKEDAKATRQARRTLTKALRQSFADSPEPDLVKTLLFPSLLKGVWNQRHSGRYTFRYLVSDGKSAKPLRLTSVLTKNYPLSPKVEHRSLWQRVRATMPRRSSRARRARR